MPICAQVTRTPYYVLMDGNRRVGPNIARSTSGLEFSSIYGFSDTSHYDAFRMHGEQTLKPYPLVKTYLRMRAGDSGDDVKLVVVDAAGPREPRLHAATIEAVLEAQEHGSAQVNAGYQLVYDADASVYRVEEVSG